MRGADLIIVGGGTMGLATAVALARRGRYRIIVLDPATSPHESGGHHGHSRLIRSAYGEGRHYVTLAQKALAGWRALARACPERAIFEPYGVLNVGDENSPFVREVIASARAFDLDIESMNAADTAARWPGWALSEAQRAVFEPAAGVLFPESILSAWRALLDDTAGVERLAGAAITDLIEDSHGYRAVAADGRVWTAPQVLLACGRAVAPLAAGIGLNLALTRVRKVFAWFEADARYGADVWPGFSYTGALGDYYGFPALHGRGVKIGRHDGGQRVAPHDIMAPFGSETADTVDPRALIEAHLPGVGALEQGAVCEYIRTPDEDFIIDSPRPGLYLAAGFSGHGFKFAPAIGQGLAQWIDAGEQPACFAPFRCDRFAQRPD